MPGEESQDAILADFGSAEAFRDAVVSHSETPPLDELPATSTPVESLGAGYREDETATTERSEVYRVDPDRIDRGTQAHSTTQNLLAEHLRSRGLTPRSWEGMEPPYDLAWEDGGAIFVAEVKSLTAQNEERQLRLALGQVLRYGQQLERIKKQAIQNVIATERKPIDSAWIELCARYDVKLVWPETFTDL